MKKNRVTIGLACAAGFTISASALAGYDEFIRFDEPGVKIGMPLPISIKNVSFSFESVGNRGIGGASINEGPYINNPGIEGPTGGYLRLNFINPVSAFGFEFALLSTGFVADAACIEMFGQGGSSLGMLCIDADGTETRGGNKGEFSSGQFMASSMAPFYAVEIKFAEFQLIGDDSLRSDFRGDTNPIDRFFFDNLGYDFAQIPTTIPLPTPALLGAIGLSGIVSIRRRRAL